MLLSYYGQRVRDFTERNVQIKCIKQFINFLNLASDFTVRNVLFFLCKHYFIIVKGLNK